MFTWCNEDPAVRLVYGEDRGAAVRTSILVKRLEV